MDNIRHFGNTKPQKSLAVKEMAAHYRISLENIGGSRRSFLCDENRNHILDTKPRWYKDKPVAIMTFLMVGMVVYTGFKLISSGINLTTLALVAIAAIMSWLHVRNVKTWQKFAQKRWDMRSDVALYFEPEALWRIAYPTQGEKGELVTAILSARKYLSLLESATTMPIAVPKRDHYYVHMIQSIMNSKDNDIHPYLYDEIEYLCESTKEYVKIYSSLISLDVELRTENM